MNAHVGPRRAAQVAQLARMSCPDDQAVAAAWGLPTISPMASLDLSAAIVTYRDHPTKLAEDFAAVVAAMYSPGVAAMVVEKIADTLLEGGV